MNERSIDPLAEPVPPMTDAKFAAEVRADQRLASDEEIVARLAALAPAQYDRVRKSEAEAIGVRPATLDKMVSAARKSGDDGDLPFDDVDPWPTPVEPPALLSEIAVTIRRFIVCDRETADAAALWVAMTWLMDVFEVAPLAVITAPEMRCGKSQLLTLIGRIAYRPLSASNITVAALFRAVDAWRPTLLIDEVDTFMKENEELRGIVNAGHTRDYAFVYRIVGDDMKPQRFNVWGAKALAGIGRLSGTLMDRAIVLELRRKLPGENVERLRHAEPGLFASLAAKLARFTDDYRESIRHARPDLPAELHDRAQDNWEPLLAIADVAGGHWPVAARRAALKLSGGAAPVVAVGTELLADIMEAFEAAGVDRLSTTELIEALCADDEKRWASFNYGKRISPRQVAATLSEYGIVSRTIRIHQGTPKGYLLASFSEAFRRYLPIVPDSSATTPRPCVGTENGVAPDPDHRPLVSPSATPNALIDKGCGGVADDAGEAPELVEVNI